MTKFRDYSMSDIDELVARVFSGLEPWGSIREVHDAKTDAERQSAKSDESDGLNRKT